MQAAEMVALLRRHFLSSDNYDSFGQNGELFVTELAAPNSARRADVVYAGLWPSRGQEVDVVEIKVSHQDFRTEINDPGKADAWWPHCTRFWIAAPDTTVAPPEMLPPGWGLLLPAKNSRHRRMQVAVQPASRQAQMTFDLMAALVQRVRTVSMREWHELGVERDEQERVAVIAARQQERALVRKATLPQDVQARLLLLDQFEAEAGFKLTSWDSYINHGAVSPAVAGAAFRRLLAPTTQLVQQERLVDHGLANTIRELKRVLKQVEQVQEQRPDLR